jgi:hypothetical protein
LSLLSKLLNLLKGKEEIEPPNIGTDAPDVSENTAREMQSMDEEKTTWVTKTTKF